MSDAAHTRPAVVYRAYAADGRLLYIGCTTSLKRRLRQHGGRSEWFRLADSLVVDGPYDKWYEAARVEAWMIRTFPSAYNRPTGAAAHGDKRGPRRPKPHRVSTIHSVDGLFVAFCDRCCRIGRPVANLAEAEADVDAHLRVYA